MTGYYEQVTIYTNDRIAVKGRNVYQHKGVDCQLYVKQMPEGTRLRFSSVEGCGGELQELVALQKNRYRLAIHNEREQFNADLIAFLDAKEGRAGNDRP